MPDPGDNPELQAALTEVEAAYDKVTRCKTALSNAWHEADQATQRYLRLYQEVGGQQRLFDA